MTRPAIGIDLGGSHATIALVKDEEILGSRRVSLDSAEPLRPALHVFAETIHKLLAELQINATECEGLALGFCGLADARIGRVVSTNKKYEDAPLIDFEEWCRQEFGLRFAIENDARMALLGERYAGAARGCDNVVMITLGTGIGGAVPARRNSCARKRPNFSTSRDVRAPWLSRFDVTFSLTHNGKSLWTFAGGEFGHGTARARRGICGDEFALHLSNCSMNARRCA